MRKEKIYADAILQHIRMKLLLYLTCFLWVLKALPQEIDPFLISGTVTDSSNGEHLIGALIFDPTSGTGTTTNEYGYFSLNIAAQPDSLLIQYIGYETLVIIDFSDLDETKVYAMMPSETLDEVVITSKTSISEALQMSQLSLPIEQIQITPVLMGEADVLRTLQLLPGIQSGTEGSAGVYVRGGGPDQNLVLLDGVPIYNASHLFGFFSVFNADALNKVDVLKGGFPARYGGRLSSVIDVSMKEGSQQNFIADGSIGLIASKLKLEGPLKNNKTTYLISGRRTYLDQLISPLLSNRLEEREKAGYFFYDVNAKINHRFSNKDRLYLSYYLGRDEASIVSDDQFSIGGIPYVSETQSGLNWGNSILALRWNHLFGKKLFSNAAVTYSRYRLRVFDETIETEQIGNIENTQTEGIRYLSGIRDWNLKYDVDYRPNPRHLIRAGASGILHGFEPGVFAYNSTSNADSTFGVTTTYSAEIDAYIEDDFKLNDHIRANLGVRWSQMIGNDFQYQFLQPRFALRWLLSNETALKISYAETAQFVHLLSNSGVGLPSDLWIPSSPNIRPQQSQQLALGISKDVNSWDLSIEAYYKEMKNLVAYENGASYLNLDNDWEEKVVFGNGSSYGVEFLLRKNTGKLTGWIGYTWSLTNRTFEDLNDGQTFPFRYDRRHDISLLGVYRFSDTWSLSSTWVFGTGNAITLPELTYAYAPRELNQFLSQPVSAVSYYSERNGYRLGNFHRLDLNVVRKTPTKFGHQSWSFGVYNVYNRKNPFYVDVRTNDDGGKELVQFSLFPMIPFIKYSFHFDKSLFKK